MERTPGSHKSHLLACWSPPRLFGRPDPPGDVHRPQRRRHGRGTVLVCVSAGTAPMGISLKPEHLKRYKDIASFLVKYGRSELISQVGLDEAIDETQPRGEA